MKMKLTLLCIVILLLALQTNQGLARLDKKLSHLEKTFVNFDTSIEEVSWFKSLKPTCDKNDFDADDQYRILSTAIRRAHTHDEEEKAKNAMHRFLLVCTYEECPESITKLEELLKKSTSNRLKDYYNSICRPYINLGPANRKAYCTNYAEDLSQVQESIKRSTAEGWQNALESHRDHYAKLKSLPCKPKSVEAMEEQEVADTISYLLNRIKNPIVSEEEAQLIVDRLVMLFNTGKGLRLKEEACDSADEAVEAIDKAAQPFEGIYAERILRYKDVLKFWCKVWPNW